MCTNYLQHILSITCTCFTSHTSYKLGSNPHTLLLTEATWYWLFVPRWSKSWHKHDTNNANSSISLKGKTIHYNTKLLNHHIPQCLSKAYDMVSVQDEIFSIQEETFLFLPFQKLWYLAFLNILVNFFFVYMTHIICLFKMIHAQFESIHIYLLRTFGTDYLYLCGLNHVPDWTQIELAIPYHWNINSAILNMLQLFLKV